MDHMCGQEQSCGQSCNRSDLATTSSIIDTCRGTTAAETHNSDSTAASLSTTVAAASGLILIIVELCASSFATTTSTAAVGAKATYVVGVALG